MAIRSRYPDESDNYAQFHEAAEEENHLHWQLYLKASRAVVENIHLIVT